MFGGGVCGGIARGHDVKGGNRDGVVGVSSRSGFA